MAIAALCLAPPVYLLVRVFEAPSTAWDALTTSSTARLLLRTVLLAVCVTTLAIAIALPLAWLTERTDLPARRLLGILAALPLAIPSYIGAMVMIAAFGPRGLLQQALEPLGVDRLPPIYGFWGTTAILALFTYPYLLLTLRPALGGLDPRLEELSRGFGYGRWTTFRRVVLPQLRPALASGGLLVALYTLSDFGAVALLRFDSFTRVIFINYQSAFDRTSAAALALLLSVLALTVVTIEVWSRGRARYHSAHGQQRQAELAPLGRWRWPALAFIAVVLLFALAAPAGVLGYWLVRGLAAGESLRGVSEAVRHSVTVATLAAGATALAALPVALLAVRHRSFLLTRPIEVLAYAGFALPGLVVALALVFLSIRLGALYQTLAVLVLAYVLLFLPQALGATRNALLQVRPSMEEASRGLGRSGGETLAAVTLPLAARGIGAGAALVFLTTMKELPATLLLSPAGFHPLSMRVWTAASEAHFARAALPALLLIAISALPLALIAAGRGRR